MYEHFEHTADLGLRARAPELNELFEECARALFAAIVEDLDSVSPDIQVTIEIEGDDLEYVLFDWLRELLYRFDAEHMLFSSFQASVSEHGLRANAMGEHLDMTRHVLSHEVKAITYHTLRVQRQGDEWVAEVIVDI
jgi:SHS2 domain-containing protein